MPAFGKSVERVIYRLIKTLLINPKDTQTSPYDNFKFSL